MKVVAFRNLDYGEERMADLVICHNCKGGFCSDAMLVPTGMERCPLCSDETEWYDDTSIGTQEVQIDKFAQSNDIIWLRANFKESFNERTYRYETIPV